MSNACKKESEKPSKTIGTPYGTWYNRITNATRQIIESKNNGLFFELKYFALKSNLDLLFSNNFSVWKIVLNYII